MAKTASTEPANIYIALAAIAQAIVAIPKDKKNEGQGFKFRGIDDCYNSLHSIFAAHGVVCIPSVDSLLTGEYTNAKGNKVFRSHVTVTYNFTAADGSSVASKVVGEAFDFGDKATNKAMSAAHKYLLLQTFLIPTHDIADADQNDYSFDADAAARKQPGAEYDGKTVEQLEALRNGIMGAGDMPPKELLGKIAELKADAQEKPTEPTPTKPAEKAATKAPAAKKKEAAPVTPPPAEEEAAPGGAEDDFMAGAEAPTKADLKPSVLGHKLTSITHSKYKDKALQEFSYEDLIELRDKWAVNPKFQVKINADPAAVKDKEMLLIAIGEWEAMHAAAKK